MTVRLTRRYGSPTQAEQIRRALAADQAGFVRATVDGSELTFEVFAERAGRARATVDDLLAAVGAAERTLGITTSRR